MTGSFTKARRASADSPSRPPGASWLPLSALRHAQITQRALILDDALRDDRFATDPAFAGADQCALMVVPILHHGTLCAVLVLENRKKRGAFSTVSSDSLASIAGPLAVSLENALLYERLEQRVAEQTSELREAQEQLVAAARRAGRAEIATNVLHNVGNILNSVNVAAEMVRSRLRGSKLGGLMRAVQMLDAHADDPGGFIARDEKGKLLPGYLRELSQALERERQESLERLGQLTGQHRPHQERRGHAAGLCGSLEPDGAGSAARLVRGCLAHERKRRWSATAWRWSRSLKSYRLLQLDKTRGVQILVNLIANAKQAMGSRDGAAHAHPAHPRAG